MSRQLLAWIVVSMVVGLACKPGNGGTHPPPPPPVPPSAPGVVQAVAEVGGATLTWSVPEEDGGSAITGYQVSGEPNDASLALHIEGTTAQVTGLRAGATYRFSVAAVNAAGMGPATDSAAVTLPDVPSAPTLLSAMRGNGKVAVTWKEPDSEGGRPVTGYLVTVSPQGKQVRLDATARSATVEGLTNGEPSTFTVRAINAVGEGPDSAPSASVVPATVPSAPTGLEATTAIREATVSWSAPASTGGLPVVEYVVTVEPDGTVLRTAADVRSTSVTGLRDGTEYTFTVLARNEVGEGQGTTSAPQRTLDVPLAPLAVKATVDVRSVTVTWEAPTGDGGSPITGYTVESWPSGPRVQLDARARTVTLPDLPSTRRFSFTVSATNAVGTGAASTPSPSVRPLPAPVQVSAIEIPSSTTGCLSISYSLQQPDGERADVVVEVDAKADGSFQRVTQAGSTDHDGLLALSTSLEGTLHRFLWNRASDVSGANPVRVRVSARVPGTAPDSKTVELALPAAARRCEPRLDTSLIRTAPGHLVAGTVGDLNRDGKPDLVAVSEDGTAFHVMLGLGNGGFQLPLRHELGGWMSTYPIPATADLDGDGTPELLWVDNFPDLNVAHGRGDGSFEVPRKYAVSSGSRNDRSPPGIAVADFDGNGGTDVAVVGGNSVLEVFLNQGDGTLGASKSLGFLGKGAQLTAVDLDEDGREDLVSTSVGGATTTLLSNGDGTFRAQYVSEASQADGMALGTSTGTATWTWPSPKRIGRTPASPSSRETARADSPGGRSWPRSRATPAVGSAPPWPRPTWTVMGWWTSRWCSRRRRRWPCCRAGEMEPSGPR